MSIFKDTCKALGTFFNGRGEPPKVKPSMGAMCYSDGTIEEFLHRPTADNPNALCLVRNGREVPLQEAFDMDHAADVAKRASTTESITVRGPLKLCMRRA